MGPLQLVIHVVQIRPAGKEKSHWDKTNKENYHFKFRMSFVCILKSLIMREKGANFLTFKGRGGRFQTDLD